MWSRQQPISILSCNGNMTQEGEVERGGKINYWHWCGWEHENKAWCGTRREKETLEIKKNWNQNKTYTVNSMTRFKKKLWLKWTSPFPQTSNWHWWLGVKGLKSPCVLSGMFPLSTHCCRYMLLEMNVITEVEIIKVYNLWLWRFKRVVKIRRLHLTFTHANSWLNCCRWPVNL